MAQVKLKVCGITSLDDAQAAIAAGAEYLGFNFYRKSPRYIAPADARVIIEQLPGEIVTVGIFVNEARPEDVIEILKKSCARMAQLHGDEDAAYCAAVGRGRVIKALRAGADFDARQVLDYPAAAILLDAFDKHLYGGTGMTANWQAAHEAAKLVNLFLAGGLSPNNIAEAVATVRPFAVDVNSGVEIRAGVKDKGKLKALAVKLAEHGN